MVIGIDASRYKAFEATGIEVYSKEIIENLIKLPESKKNKIILFSRENLESLKTTGIENMIIPFKRFWTLYGLSKEMRKKTCDALFVPSHTLPLIRAPKTVITIHDLGFKYFRKAYSFLQYHYLDWSTKYAVKKADKIIVPSNCTKDDLIKFYKCPENKIEVIYHGFSEPNIDQKHMNDVFENSDLFEYFNITKDLKYILFVGRIESKKNVSVLLRAFKIFHEKNPEYKLILAGKRGVGFDEVLKTANELELMNSVIFTGYVTEDEKYTFYKYAQMFVMPSLFEGFGFPVLEAYYFKTPTICSDTSSLKEIFENVSLFFESNNFQDLSEKMQNVISDKKLKDDLISKGSTKLQEFDWKKTARETLEVIVN